MTSGNHLDRFFIAFIDENALPENASLSTTDNELNTTVVNYLRNTKELYINTNSTQNIKNIRIYSILGKELFVKSNVNTREIKIPMAYLNTNYGIVSVETDKGITSKKVILQ
jgi:predicted transcriptional regulator